MQLEILRKMKLPEELYGFLDEHQLSYEAITHEAVFTVEESSRLVPDLPGAKTKNLFIRNKAGDRHFLVVVGHEKRVDLKGLARELGTSKLSLGSPRRLELHMGQTPGSVSLMALVNDVGGAVELVVDTSVWEAEAIQCHPLANTATIVISRDDVDRFLDATSHSPVMIDVPAF